MARNLYKALFSYRSGDMYAPQIDISEALRIEASRFGDCIVNGTVPITDGYAGPRVVCILEAATRSMKERGKTVRPDLVFRRQGGGCLGRSQENSNECPFRRSEAAVPKYQR